jgi:hypothetical protein
MPAPSKDDDTNELLERTSWGDELARDRLLERHRARLRTMIAVRLDRRYLARIDPSDVDQDVPNASTFNPLPPKADFGQPLSDMLDVADDDRAVNISPREQTAVESEGGV